MKQIQYFWNWFQDNEHAIVSAYFLDNNAKEVFSHLERNLGYISKKIKFLIKEQEKPEKFKIIFTSEGCRKVFAKLIALEEQAPDLKFFYAQAFIKPSQKLEKIKLGEGAVFVFRNYKLNVSTLQFALLDFNVTTKELKIAIYTTHFNSLKKFEDFHETVSFILMEIVGEINYKNHIKDFELKPRLPDQIGLLDIIELQEYIDYLYKINSRNQARFI